jgi:hypothetical protein
MGDVLLTSRAATLRLDYGSWLSLLEWGRRGGWDERRQPAPNPEDVAALWPDGYDTSACLYSAEAALSWGRAIRRVAPVDPPGRELAARFADFTQGGAFRAEWGG